MSQLPQLTVASPLLVCYLSFDSTTGALKDGSWGGSLVVNTVNRIFTITPLAPGQSGAHTNANGNLSLFVDFIVVADATRKLWARTNSAAAVSFTITDLAGTPADLGANTTVHVFIWQSVPL